MVNAQKIYFIRRPDTREVKIGISRTPEVRMAELQCASAGDLVLATTYDGGYKDEAKWHEVFAEDRIAREWFRESPSVSQAIEGIREMLARGLLSNSRPGDLSDDQTVAAEQRIATARENTRRERRRRVVVIGEPR